MQIETQRLVGCEFDHTVYLQMGTTIWLSSFFMNRPFAVRASSTTFLASNLFKPYKEYTNEIVSPSINSHFLCSSTFTCVLY